MNATPGPWKVGGTSTFGAPLIFGPGRLIAKVLHYDGSENNETNADAALIAAAPTMYEYIQHKAEEGDARANEIMSSLR